MTARTATILVTDLVGSTEQRVRLGEERAEALRRVHDRLAADVVAGAGGTVVKGLGDGVLATFPGAAEAVGAAVMMQRAAAAHTRHHPDVALVLRAGISAGDVEAEGADVFGTPVVEAARLCALADGGQILVAELARLLTRGRGGHRFRPVGELVLKGLADPVPTVEVVWAAGPGRPLPPLLQVTRTFGMVGRQAERERLRQLWRQAATGGRQVALVAGEPGIGKTRLVAELAADAAEDEAVVVYGHCDEELEAPFRPWTEVVRALLATLPTDASAVPAPEWW